MKNNITNKIGEYLEEIDMNRMNDYYFEIKELERELEKYKQQKKELMKNDLNDEFDWSKIDNKIKKTEDKIRYLKRK